MVTLQDSLLSSSARKLPIRKRPDLSARRQQYLGRSYWVVKEPVGLNYFRFQDEEFAILNMLDGNTSLDEIKERFEAEFPPQKITLEELQQFLGMLHRSGLVTAAVPGQGHQLRKRRDERRRKEILGACSNILCIRFKGFDPERILNWLYPKVRWCFTRAMLAICLALAVSALTLVIVEFDVFRSKLPGFYQFFSPTNALLIAATLGLTKVVHEFAHGLSCKHFGGECHEIGIMILVLTPCLYCNVSDSWMLPNKWHRAMIGAAGIFVEVTLAAVCTFVWWFSEPATLLSNLCLNVMFISSVSTILFNANPLLRYDGYYILADVVEIPNLRQKATTILSRKLAHWCLGLEPPDDPFLPQRNQVFFALYSVAAAVYRWFILASILWFMYQVFKPYGLQVIGQIIIGMSLYGLVGMPLYKVAKFFYVPGRIDKVKKPRMFASLGLLAATVAAFVFVPLPHSIICPLEIRARDAVPVYVSVSEGGRLDPDAIFVRYGERVTAGAPLVHLENTDIHLEITRLEGAHKQYEKQLRSLRRQRFSDPQAAEQIPQIQEALATVRQQLDQQQADYDRLKLSAPVAGTVLPPPAVPEREDPSGQLSGWSGTPLEPKNAAAHLPEGTMVCELGDPDRMEAVLVVEQTDRNFIEAGQKVDIKLNELPHDVYRSTITRIAQQEMESVSKALTTKYGGDVPSITDSENGEERPQNTSYQAWVPLDDPRHLLRLGLIGRAKVHAKWLPLGTRLWRFISHTFNFEL